MAKTLGFRPGDTGSIPVEVTKMRQGVAQLVECSAWDAEVTGSSPVTLTNSIRSLR